MKEQLHEPTLVAEDLASGDLPIAGHAGLIGNLLLGQDVFRRTDHRDLGDGVDADRKVIGHGIGLDIEHVAGRQSPLFGRGRSEARISDDITGREDMGHGGSELAVHLQSSPLIGNEAGRRQIQAIGRADAPSRKEHQVRHDPFPGLEQDEPLAAVDHP